jgi:threonine dehydrogenase-like Zn-dependent dehydrogenase
MRHATFSGEGRISVGEGAAPVVAAREVLLRVLACSLCGSDLRPLRQGWPVTPGHEIVGRVDQPGHRLHGQRCLVYIPVWCGHCEQCLAGHTQLCDKATELIGWQRAGGYAEALAVPEQCLLPVPDDVPTHLAPLLLDTIGTAAHSVRLSQALVPAGRALILGAGPIGLGALLVLQQFGYGPVQMFDPNVFRRGVAAELGGVALDTLDGIGRYPLVLECSGKDAARQAALEAVAARGVVIQLGEADAWQVTETKAIRRKDFYYVRSFYFPIAEYALNIELLRADTARYERLVDARVPLEGLQELFAQFAHGERLKPQLSLTG